MLGSGKNTTCFEVTLSITQDSFERPKDISWTLGSCSSERSYDPTDDGEYKQECCLATGTHDLLCKESTGIGWTFSGNSTEEIESGYIEVGVTRYCENFTQTYPPRFAMANKVHILGEYLEQLDLIAIFLLKQKELLISIYNLLHQPCSTDKCSPNPCKNNGTCKAHKNGWHECECQENFVGIQCEVFIKGSYFISNSFYNLM